MNEYFNQLQKVYDYLGFKEDWVVLPLDDRREYHWFVTDDDVVFGDKDDVINQTGNHYSDEIYKQRFYDKWVYRGEEYTMVMVNTHVDGNRFLAIYDNSKEITLISFQESVR